MLLRLTDISRLYGQRLIFKAVSLTLEPGSIMLLTGANGAGKSTLLKIMAGLTDPDSGSVELNLAPGAQLGYMGHQTFIYPQLSALENLRFWSRLYGIKPGNQANLGARSASGPLGQAPARQPAQALGKHERSSVKQPVYVPDGTTTQALEQAPAMQPAQALGMHERSSARQPVYVPDGTTTQALEQVLEQVELKRFAHEKAGTFSRGMAQRLNLARILLLKPQLLLLDEPSTGLDIRSRAMLDAEILQAKERGTAIVWISHSLAEDLPKADLVAELGPVNSQTSPVNSQTSPANSQTNTVSTKKTRQFTSLAYFGPASQYTAWKNQTGRNVRHIENYVTRQHNYVTSQHNAGDRPNDSPGDSACSTGGQA